MVWKMFKIDIDIDIVQSIIILFSVISRDDFIFYALTI